MLQLSHKLKNGLMSIIDVPPPMLVSGRILVRNYYSLISPGTEGASVRAARQNFFVKARGRPQEVRQAFDVLRNQGATQTYRAVMKKLDSYSSLGYSCVGEVIGVPSNATSFRLGDIIAAGGPSASHSEVVSVPLNLCVKIPPSSDFKQAAYNTLGSIALQGVRQADLHIGEACVVIGLGLLGQLTSIILRASGVRTVGIDIDQSMVSLAAQNSVDLAMNRDDPGILDKIAEFTGGLGCDAVIITAGTSSLDPINFAGAAARKRGTVVAVGVIPTGFDREPHYYRKELQLRMSCSYGPGRYDPNYEEKGQDYPVGYVRWTENRNMQAFQELIHSKKIDVSFLTTHLFKLEDAPKAYDMILQKSEPSLGILIEYDIRKEIKLTSDKVDLKPSALSRNPCSVSIGFIGAGSYAQSHLLPNIPKNKDIALKGVMTSTGASARSSGERFGFEFCTTDEKDILENEEINTVFIATRHDSHADLVLKALRAGKHVFVEKPLCLTFEHLEEIVELVAQGIRRKAQGILMVGYNRRFSPLAKKIKDKLGSGPMAMIYRVNAGAIPSDSWIQDPEIGGGRIIGEVCHFVDTLNYLTGSIPLSLYAVSMTDPHNHNDTVQACLKYADGSMGTIAYLANGDRGLSKERLEVFAHGTIAVLDDFKVLTTYSNGKKNKKSLLSQNKGQKNEVRSFLESIRKGGSPPITFEEIYYASLVPLKIIESIQRGVSIQL